MKGSMLGIVVMLAQAAPVCVVVILSSPSKYVGRNTRRVTREEVLYHICKQYKQDRPKFCHDRISKAFSATARRNAT